MQLLGEADEAEESANVVSVEKNRLKKQKYQRAKGRGAKAIADMEGWSLVLMQQGVR